MENTSALPAQTPAETPGLMARIIGIVFSPRATYAAVVRRPQIVGVLLITLLTNGGLQFWLFSSEPGRRATTRQMEERIRQMEAQGQEVSAEGRAFMEGLGRVLGPALAGAQIVVGPVVLAFFAIVTMALLNALIGGAATFRQMYAVFSHSGVIGTVGVLFQTPLMYVTEDVTSPTSLRRLAPFGPEDTFVAHLLGGLDLVFIWWFFNLAIGLAVLYRSRTAPFAISLLGLYAGVMLVVALVQSF
jgi:hypothetical protein